MIAPFEAEQQGSSQPRLGWRQSHWRIRCRALVGHLLIAVALIGVGCGAVEFVPSPYTPQNVDVIYSEQEDISIVRWMISSTAPGSDLEFQILEESGYQTIDFSQSVYPGGASACRNGVGSCFQYVVRGQYAFAPGDRPVQAVHPLYGVLPGAVVVKLDVEATTLQQTSFFDANDDQIFVQITDRVASDVSFVYLYPRSYDRTMWPTTGLCVSASAPDGVSFLPLDPLQKYGFPPDSPLTNDGIYCVGVRPVPSDGGAAAVAQSRAETRPQVVDMHQTFIPPVEQAPIIYQIVLDLEIPIGDRCDSALKKIEMLVDEYMNKANAPVPVVKLPTMNIAVDPNATGGAANCAQVNQPTLPAADMAEAVLQNVSSFPEQYQQYQFFFFSNLDSVPLPSTLTDALSTLFSAVASAPAPYQVRVLSWLFNPQPLVADATAPSLWTVPPQSWQSVDDPSLEMALATFAMQNLPYESQTHDAGTPVPLLSTADAATYAGGQIKICDSSPMVTPTDVNTPTQLFRNPSWPILASNPPGYLVTLPPRIGVPYTSFVEERADVDFQVCTRYCDGHPYIDTAGRGEMSWSGSYLCAGTD